jgi:hydrogenase expression/formation protein HypD
LSSRTGKGIVSERIAVEIALKIRDNVGDRDLTIMEVCGTHTRAIFRTGIKSLLPAGLKMVAGPGCPVCVTPERYFHTAIELAKEENFTLATFGDLMRVPSGGTSLEREKALGSDILAVYSPMEALKLAEKRPDRVVVFLAVGFETTQPAIASTIIEAKSKAVPNFMVLSGGKLIPPAMMALVQDEELQIDGFLCPGHVSTIIGPEPYEPIANHYKIPCAIAGFEPVEILLGILDLTDQIRKGVACVSNLYGGVVKKGGNWKAMMVLNEVFTVADTEWRGIGVIPNSGLRIGKEYSKFDADMIPVDLSMKPVQEDSYNCICGQIIKGKQEPTKCPEFMTRCTPANPIGACMVSNEGTCRAYCLYSREDKTDASS